MSTGGLQVLAETVALLVLIATNVTVLWLRKDHLPEDHFRGRPPYRSSVC